MSATVLVRYGTIPDVSRFAADFDGRIDRGERVVVQSPRGVELGTLLEPVGAAGNDSRGNGTSQTETTLRVLRAADPADLAAHEVLRRECEAEFEVWRERIAGWKLQLELIDLEWTLDRARLILYVLNERGPDCTKLALYAAAAGLGTIEVQPVTAAGPTRLEKGGCGSGGCGCGD